MMDFPNSLDDFDGVAAFVVLLGASRGGSLGAPAHSAGNGD